MRGLKRLWTSAAEDHDESPERLPRKTLPGGIRELYNPEEGGTVDIVFVHGLTGDRDKTWSARDAAEPWPKILLPSRLPTARVLTFGYDAYVADWRGVVSQNRIASHAWNLLTSLATYRENDDKNERPLIFVCHSLGGLVCEDALVTSRQRQERHLQSILRSTRGILFLGTPHHGAGLARWAELLSQSIGFVKQTNPDIVAVLRRDSEVLARIQDSFHTMVMARSKEGLPPIEISCFFEELPMPGVGVVVPRDSAILPGYIPIGIHSDHGNMTKFDSTDDPGFVAVCGELRRWIRGIDAAQRHRENPPPSNNSNFDERAGVAVQRGDGNKMINDVGEVKEQNNIDGNSFKAKPINFVSHQQATKTAEQIQIDERNACLVSLGFSSIDAREKDIAYAHPGTCDWLFETNEFWEWCNRADLLAHNGVLWIKGKPGAGKSTLMKHTLRHCRRVFSDYLVVAHFFNARGAAVEKTLLGLLRSVVYQLLKQDATLYEQFLPMYRRQKTLQKGEWDWLPAELKDFVLSVVEQPRLNLVFLVDALDECDKPDVLRVIEFLELLSGRAVQAGTILRVCLSSRHFPYVDMKKALRIVVEKQDEHAGDIAQYIDGKLQTEDKEIMAQVQKRAGGVFMWVVIVVALLNRHDNEGRPEAMQETLNKVPDDLEGVFSTLLSQDDQSKGETLRMLQWVLLSQRPLMPEELFFAVVPETVPAYAGPWNRSKVTMTVMEKRITSSSKGLIEMQNAGDAVQFIHLTVSEFLYRQNRLQTLDLTLEPDPVAASHGRLWACCWSRLKQQDTTIVSEEHMRELSSQYPFLRYAAGYIFDHAEKALSGRVMHEEVTQWLEEQDSWFQWWQAFVNAIDFPEGVPILQDDMDAAYEKSFYLQHNKRAGLLYIVSLACCCNLARTVLKRGANINAEGGVYGTALQAASFRGSYATVALLLEEGADVNAEGGYFGTALQAASYQGHREIVALLLEQGADVNAEGGYFGTALQAASYQGHREIVALLLGRGADVNAESGEYGTSLQAASYHARRETILLLLEHGADVEADGGRHGTALDLAWNYGDRTTLELLEEWIR